MQQLVLLVTCLFAVCSAFPFRYPGIILCTTTSPAPNPTCSYRVASSTGFVPCSHHTTDEIALNSNGSMSSLFCSTYNRPSLRHGALVAKDTGSIITFVQQSGTSRAAYAALWNTKHNNAPLQLDEFVDLIYLFEDHGLITVQGELGLGNTTAMFSVGLHTHADPSPQEIWVRIDPLYRVISSTQ